MQKTKFIPDKKTSLFWWCINLDTDATTYISNNETTTIFGYSCKQGFTEYDNKMYCLAHKLIFLYENYYPISKEISIHYHKLHGLIEIDREVRKELLNPVIWIEKNNISFSPLYNELFTSEDKKNKFTDWASRLNNWCWSGKSAKEYQQKTMDKTQKQKTFEDYLNPLKQAHLNTMDKLHNYLLSLQKKQFSNVQIENFYLEFLTIKPNLK